MRQINLGNIELFTKRDILDFVVVNNVAQGVIARNLIEGNLEVYKAHCVVLQLEDIVMSIFFLQIQNQMLLVIWRAHKKGANFANPSFTQIHPTCIPPKDSYQSKLTLMRKA